MGHPSRFKDVMLAMDFNLNWPWNWNDQTGRSNSWCPQGFPWKCYHRFSCIYWTRQEKHCNCSWCRLYYKLSNFETKNQPFLGYPYELIFNFLVEISLEGIKLCAGFVCNLVHVKIKFWTSKLEVSIWTIAIGSSNNNTLLLGTQILAENLLEDS